MFIILNPAVAINAELNPVMSNDTSLTVAMATPIMIGRRDKYTLQLYLSPMNILDIMTVKNGIVARKIKERVLNGLAILEKVCN
jgi:hypothetical protein